MGDGPIFSPSWLIQTELERDRDWDQEKKWVALFHVCCSHCATYVGTYTLTLHSPSPGPGSVPVQALSEWAITMTKTKKNTLNKAVNIGRGLKKRYV